MKNFLPAQQIRTRARNALLCTAFAASLSAHPQTNAWMKPTSGSWEEFAWSLGRLPGPGQAIQITNSGWKAVAIKPSTATSYPATLNILTLALGAPSDSMSVLLLNSAGTTVPLRVEADAIVGAYGQIVNQSSGFSVAGNLVLDNGEVRQDWGITRVGGALRFDGGYYLTNGLLQAGEIWVAISNNADFAQYGGRTEAGSVYVGALGVTPLLSDGTYYLYGGVLFSTNLVMGGGMASTGRFRHEGGTNQTGVLILKGMGSASRYELLGGRLETAETDLRGTGYNSVYFHQAGGSHIVTGVLSIEGGIHSLYQICPGEYQLTGGELEATTLAIANYGVYLQTNGTVRVKNLILNGGSGFARMEAVLAGGSIEAETVDHGQIGVDLLQTGGALNVAGTFAFGGIGPYGASYARYRLLGGQLTTSNIDLSADLIVAGGPGRISNTGFFKSSGTPPTGATLTFSNAVEHLGRLILGSTASLFLGGSSSKVFFNDSSAEPWMYAPALYILNWNGSVSGGGADQVVFGNSAAGLNPHQLALVQFVDAAGFPGTNNAKILATGEVVPTTQPRLLSSRPNGSALLSWPGNYVLESSPNVVGPFQPVTGVTSPYPLGSNLTGMMFFRLRQP